jgi:hypothetical protein
LTSIGQFEHVVLAAILAMGNDAYGVTIHARVEAFAQITGQPSVEVFASCPRDFFYKVVDAQLTFEVGADGRATAVVLHQFGRDQRAAHAP